MTDFAIQVWEEAQRLRPRAKNLWRDEAEREDGISETIVRSISKQHLFDGANLAAWMTTIMGNLRRDQALKGYARSKKITEPRMIYVGEYDYASHIPTLDSPEAILIATEEYGGRVDQMQRRRRKYLRACEKRAAV